MKESYGGTWLFQIVIFFILVFTGYLCLSINHSRAFNIKDDIVTIVERYGNIEHLNTTSRASFEEEITELFEKEGYHINGQCDSGWVGYNNLGQKQSMSSSNSAFCLRQIIANSSGTGNCTSTTGSNQKCSYYYQIETFYQLDIPIFNSVFNLKVKGDTMVNFIEKYN